MGELEVKAKRFNTWITIISIVIPVLVALLFRVKLPGVEPLTMLPPIYAGINALTAVLLVLAVVSIKNGNQQRHQQLMQVCIGLSLLFLIMYVAYHMTSESTPYGGEGIMKYVYFFILISHIFLSIVVIPLVLKTYARAYLKDFKRHRKLARITFPIWLYVAISGVVVYLMISPYYTH
jgi:putative membrane protein